MVEGGEKGGEIGGMAVSDYGGGCALVVLIARWYILFSSG